MTVEVGSISVQTTAETDIIDLTSFPFRREGGRGMVRSERRCLEISGE